MMRVDITDSTNRLPISWIRTEVLKKQEKPDLDQSVKSGKIHLIRDKPLPLPSFHKPWVW
jgi:hypothetical protein